MNRAVQPSIQPLKQFNIQHPVCIELPNGIPLNVINAGEQDVVRLDILFEGGRWSQKHKLQALFTNRMLREGTRQYTSSYIAEKLDYYGSWLELSCGATYTCVTVYSLTKYMAETLDIVESMIKEPLFPQKELNVVIDINVQQYLVNLSKVNFISKRTLLYSVYGPQHPCGKIAEEHDYRQITPEMLREYYEENYNSECCSIYLSGKVTPEVIHRVTTVFGESFGKHHPHPQYTYPISSVAEKRIMKERRDALQSSVKIGTHTITCKHPDYLKLRVVMTLLGGYFGSRLMTNIREEKGYTYGIVAGIVPYPDSGLLIISAETANQYVESLIQEVYKEIDILHQDIVSNEELTMVQNYMLGEMCRSYESPFSLADAWIFVATSGLDKDFYAHSLQAINEITPQEIRDLAQKYLCKETLKEVVTGKKM